MCGATDCASCGPAQGYTVVRRYVRGRWTYVKPEDDEAEADEWDAEPDEDAADRAADRYERDIDAMRP